MPIPKISKGEDKAKFMDRCMSNSIMVSDYADPAQRYAICSGAAKYNTRHDMESYNDYPDAVKNNAKKGIKLNEAIGNKCATQVGRIRSSQLSNGEAISINVIKRMYSYLSRAEVYYQEADDNKSCGYISYLLWGGQAAKRWAESKLKELQELSVFSAVVKPRAFIFTKSDASSILNAYPDLQVERSDKKPDVKYLYQHDFCLIITDDPQLFSEIKKANITLPNHFKMAVKFI
jgi:hypothetical protein